MSQRYLGGVITANPTTPTMTTQSGVWTLEQQFQYFNVWSPKIVGNSLRFRSSASAYLNRTPASAGSLTTWTWSGWVKLGAISSPYSLFGFQNFSAGVTDIRHYISFDSGGLVVYYADVGLSITYAYVQSSAIYRDPSAWYHVVAVWDTTNATANDRVRLYVNGSRITAFANNTQPSQNRTGLLNSAVNTGIACLNRSIGPAFLFDGYLAEINFIDGQALTPSSFGAFDSTGVWQPLPYTGTYGTNGFYLTFSDNSGTTSTTLGRDTSGNNNNWTPNNFSLTSGVTYDWMLDSPTNWTSGTGNGRGNYAVLSPLSRFSTGGTLSNGNLTCALSGAVGNNKPTFGAPSGKWYAEFTISSLSGQAVDLSLVSVTPDATSAKLRADYCSNGQTYNYGTSSYVSYGAGWASGDVIGVAWDLDANQVTFYRNGTSQGTLSTPSLGTNASGGDVSFTINNSSAQSVTFSVNHGQRPFAYTPPSGFKALNTLNLPDPTIMNGASYMAATTYTGNGGTQTVANSGGFAPDFVWIKNRGTATDHGFFDTVRGATKRLASNLANAETTEVNSLTAFTSTGFTVGATQDFNQNAVGLVGWQWKEGATQGFDIVTYTGNGTNNRAINHNLGVTPAFIIVKDRTNAFNWDIYHQSLGINATLIFTTAATRNVSAFGTSAPTSTVFYTQNNYTNTNSANLVAYLFAQVSGYSAFGSYTGNGSTDGPFVFCGFRPRWVMWKKTSGTSNWSILDTARDDFNVADNPLLPNTSGAETTSTSTSGAFADILSNGFKLRGNSGDINDSGATYIYAAFAENPFKISRAR